MYLRQAQWARDRLGLDIEYRASSIYDIGELPGTFDVIVFLGLFYHLRYPQLGLDLLATKCSGSLIMNTPIVVSEARVMELRLPPQEGQILQGAEPRYNWWFPSSAAVQAMLATAGFTNIVEFAHPETPFVSSSPHADNSSAFPTGATYFRAEARANGTLPRPMTA